MQTTSQDFSPTWHAFSATSLIGKHIPSISEVLACKPRCRKPNKVHVDLSNFPLLQQEKMDEECLHADRILSAHKIPHKFPVSAEMIRYPSVAKRGASNVLFRTTSLDIGSKRPDQHQLPERYFPLLSGFSKGFPSRTPLTALSTSQTRSRVHSSLDESY